MVNLIETYTCKNHKTDTTSQVPTSEVIQIALNIIRETGRVKVDIGEVDGRSYLYVLKTDKTYTVDGNFGPAVIALAAIQGLTVEDQDGPSDPRGPLVGRAGAPTSMTLIKV